MTDPDDYRDGAICDGVPDARWARVRGLGRARPTQQGEDDERAMRELRGRAERLTDALHRLAPDAPPPTIPDGDACALRAHCEALERRIAELRQR